MGTAINNDSTAKEQQPENGLQPKSLGGLNSFHLV